MSFRIGLVIGLSLTLGAILGATLGAETANAQGAHTWVASFGDDASTTCSRAAPCRSFGFALNKTNAGGEITCVDSSVYGSLAINKSITINCLNTDGHLGNTQTNTATSSAIIQFITESDKVILRGLDLDFGGADSLGGLDGLFIKGAGTVVLEKLKISNAKSAGNSGINYQPTGAGKLVVLDSLIANNGNGTGAGIRVYPYPGGTAQVYLERVSVVGNAFGIAVDGSNSTGGINVTIKDSSMASNSQDGVVATSSASTAPIGVAVIDSALINNGYGIRSIGSNVTVRAEGSKIIGNGTGLSGGGALLSGGGNTVQANASNGGFTGSYALQ